MGLAMMKFQELKLKSEVAAKRVRDCQVSASCPITLDILLLTASNHRPCPPFLHRHSLWNCRQMEQMRLKSVLRTSPFRFAAKPCPGNSVREG